MPREWLKALRRHNGMTQRTLSERLAVSWRSVQEWESGNNSPSRDKMLLLADLLGSEVLDKFAAEAREKGVA